MPTLHLLHGWPGSGKTGYARKLARDCNAVRFTPDEWMVALHGTNPPEALFRPQHTRIMTLIWAHAERVLRTGTDVVIDAGFWTRASRDEARRWAKAIPVECVLHALVCSREEARERVLKRTAIMPIGELAIDGPTFDYLAAQLEPLGADEPHQVVAADGGSQTGWRA